MNYRTKVADVLVSVSTVSLLLLVVGTNSQIFFRNIGEEIAVLGEVFRIMLIFMIFGAIPKMTFSHQHIRINYFYELISRNIDIDPLVKILEFLTYTAIFYSSVSILSEVAGRTTPLLEVPRMLLYIPAVISFGIIILGLLSMNSIIKRVAKSIS